MEVDKQLNSLVSIIVITYNSSKCILETLESAKAQTYQNIELIVSDDCSTDNTVKICRVWIEENKNRFERTELIIAPDNTGISANCNRGLKAAKGEWVKLIAGDDTLVDTCITDFRFFINSMRQDVYAIHANMNIFYDTFNSESFLKIADYSNDYYNIDTITPNEQYQVNLRRRGGIGAPSVFLKRELLIKISGWDEKMPYEDWPMFLNINKKGYKIYYMNKVVVNYRVHNESIYNKGCHDKSKIFFNDFFLKDREVYKKYRRNNLYKGERYLEEFDFLRKKIFYQLGLTRNNLISRKINHIFNKIIFRLRRRYLLKVLEKISKK